MDSDCAPDDSTGNAIRVEWVAEHASPWSKGKAVTKALCFSDFQAGSTPLCQRKRKRISEELAFVRLRFLRSFVVNSVISVTAEV
jgi:hypothetical protein